MQPPSFPLPVESAIQHTCFRQYIIHTILPQRWLSCWQWTVSKERGTQHGELVCFCSTKRTLHTRFRRKGITRCFKVHSQHQCYVGPRRIQIHPRSQDVPQAGTFSETSIVSDQYTTTITRTVNNTVRICAFLCDKLDVVRIGARHRQHTHRGTLGRVSKRTYRTMYRFHSPHWHRHHP